MAFTVSRQLGGTLSGARGTVHGRNAGSSPFALESNHVRMQNGAGLYDKTICLRYDRNLDQQSGAAGTVTLGVLGPFPTDVILCSGASDGRVVSYGTSYTVADCTVSIVLRNPITTLSRVLIGDLTVSSTVSNTMTVVNVNSGLVLAGQTCTAVLVKAGTGTLSTNSRLDFYIKMISIGDAVPLNIGMTLASFT